MYEIVERKEELISQAENIYAKNINSLKYNTNKIPQHKIVFQKEEFFKNLERNILIAEKYLNYEKVFITAVIKEETTNLEILNDSYHDLILESINLINPKENIGLADTIEEQNTLSLSLNAGIYQSKLGSNNVITKCSNNRHKCQSNKTCSANCHCEGICMFCELWHYFKLFWRNRSF